MGVQWWLTPSWLPTWPGLGKRACNPGSCVRERLGCDIFYEVVHHICSWYLLHTIGVLVLEHHFGLILSDGLCCLGQGLMYQRGGYNFHRSTLVYKSLSKETKFAQDGALVIKQKMRTPFKHKPVWLCDQFCSQEKNKPNQEVGSFSALLCNS